MDEDPNLESLKKKLMSDKLFKKREYDRWRKAAIKAGTFVPTKCIGVVNKSKRLAKYRRYYEAVVKPKREFINLILDEERKERREAVINHS